MTNLEDINNFSNISYLSFHNIIRPCGSVPWFYDVLIYIMRVSQNIENICLLFIHLGCIWKFGWGCIPGTLRMNFVHPRNIYMTHCSSQWNFLKNIINNCIVIKISTTFTIFLQFKLTLFIICIGVKFFLFSKFLPMKVRYWRPMPDAKYTMEHNYAIE
jgi:hypothetical protein